jgi:Fic family protein
VEALEKAGQLKAELDSLHPFDAEREARVWQKLRLDWNYHSNKLEGNSYTYGETKMLLYTGNTAGGKPQKDSEEISGHNEAINLILEVIKDRTPLTEGLIRHLHQMILVKPHYTAAKTFDGSPTKKLIKVGEYKTEPNHVETETGETFHFAEPIDTPAKMEELVKWFREKTHSSETNPILLAAEFHYRFVRIHPFDDGNGRMARLLMNFILMQYGYPPVIIRNEDKSNYIAALTQSNFEILKPFLDYIAANLVRSLEMMIKGLKGEDIEEPGDLDKELAILERNLSSIKENTPAIKSLEIIIELFNNSVGDLIGELLKMCHKFDRFYNNAFFDLIMDGSGSHASEEEILSVIVRRLRSANSIPTKCRFQYSHGQLKNVNFTQTAWHSGVNITFELTSFVVEDDYGQHRLVKMYGDQLDEEEINSIVNDLAKQHKNYIEKKTIDIRTHLEEIKSTLPNE